MILSWRTARRLVIAVIGGTVVLFGAAFGWMPFVPTIVLIPAGLAILATEFVWAQRLLKKVKEQTAGLSGIFNRKELPPDLKATNPAEDCGPAPSGDSGSPKV